MILGVCDGHDSGAALVLEGELIFAVSEERLTGRKHQAGFPERAVAACLAWAGGPRAIDGIAVAEVAGRLPTRLLDTTYRSATGHGALGLRSRALAAWSRRAARRGPGMEAALSAAVLDLRLRRFGLRGSPVLVDHHRCHARTAMAGIDDGLVATLDAFGDGLSATISRAHDGRLEVLEELPAPDSPALLFAQVTQLLGFGEGDEGKVVARAAHGDPARLRGELRTLLQLRDGRFVLRAPLPRLRRLVSTAPPEDVAAALQERVEEVVCAWLDRARSRYRGEQLGLAGGLFANVAVNRAVARVWERTFVFPAMGDAGLCAGAAWELAARQGHRIQPMVDARLGPKPGALPAGAAVVSGVDAAAEALLAGEPLARCSGRLEFGPRALGNRSLLLRPDRPELAQELNRRLDRDPMMPFGPLMTDEAAGDLLEGADRLVGMTPFMTVAAVARPELRQLAPASVHRDGTARAQVLSEWQDPELYALLRRVPGQVCINTSLNRHGDPIAASASDAVSAARTAGARVWS